MKQILPHITHNAIYQAIALQPAVMPPFSGTHFKEEKDHFEPKKKTPPPEWKERPWLVKKALNFLSRGLHALGFRKTALKLYRAQFPQAKQLLAWAKTHPWIENEAGGIALLPNQPQGFSRPFPQGLIFLGDLPFLNQKSQKPARGGILGGTVIWVNPEQNKDIFKQFDVIKNKVTDEIREKVIQQIISKSLEFSVGEKGEAVFNADYLKDLMELIDKGLVSEQDVKKSLYQRVASILTREEDSTAQRNIKTYGIVIEYLKACLERKEVQSNPEQKEVMTELLNLYSDVRDIISRNPQARSFNEYAWDDRKLLVHAIIWAEGHPSEIVGKAGANLDKTMLGGTDESIKETRDAILKERKEKPELYKGHTREKAKEDFLSLYKKYEK